MAAQVDLSRWIVGPAVGVLAALVGLMAGIDPKLAIAASFSAAFVILVIADLAWGLALFTFVAFLEIVPFGGPALSFSKLLGGLLLVSWLAVMTAQRVKVDLAVVRPACVILACLLGWIALSSTWAEDPALSRALLGRIALNAMMFVIILTAVSERRVGIRLVIAFVLGALVAALYGFAAPSQFQATYGRLESAALDPNELAAVLVPACMICMFAAIGLTKRPGIRLLAAGTGIICGATVALTVSRGGLVALAVALVVAFFVAGKWRWRIGLIAATIGAAMFIYFAGFASPAEVEHLKSTTQGDTRVKEGRVTIWEVAWRIAEQNPARGIGAGNFQVASRHYVLEAGSAPRSDLIIDTPLVVHNTYLEFLAELGIPGLVAWLALLGFCLGSLIRAARSFKRQGDFEMELIARGLFAALAGLLVADFFISDQFGKALWILLALGPAMLIIARRAASSADETATATWTPGDPAASRWAHFGAVSGGPATISRD